MGRNSNHSSKNGAPLSQFFALFGEFRVAGLGRFPSKFRPNSEFRANPGKFRASVPNFRFEANRRLLPATGVGFSVGCANTQPFPCNELGPLQAVFGNSLTALIVL